MEPPKSIEKIGPTMHKKLFFIIYFSYICAISNLLAASKDSWRLYKAETLQKLSQFPGWCSKEKAEKLMDFLYTLKPQLCVEIGTYGGSTTYPLTRALSFLKRGTLFTIDAWDPKVAAEGLIPHTQEHSWWSTLDLKAIRAQCTHLLQTHNLDPWYQIMPMRSQQAVELFRNESIDFLYIDGNYSKKGSLRDAELYYPKVKKNGYIVINDAHFQSKNETIAFLMNRCTWLKEASIKNECIIFINTPESDTKPKKEN